MDMVDEIWMKVCRPASCSSCRIRRTVAMHSIESNLQRLPGLNILECKSKLLGEEHRLSAIRA